MTKFELYPEKQLLQSLAAGDEEVFAFIYQKYSRSIYHFIVKYVQSVPLAEDLAQEVFIKVWENRNNLLQVQTFKSYLFVIARNHTLNCMKAAFRSQAAMGLIINSFISQRNATEEELLHKEYVDFLNHILDSLPQRTRQIFRMCREQGKTYEEVSAELGISRNAVKNHMVVSMKVLSVSLKKELGLALGIFLAVLHRH